MILFLIFFFKFDKKPEPHDTNITNHYNQLKMSYKSNAPTGRLAIIDYEKCQPKKCNKECGVFCPVNLQGKQCVSITDIEDLGKKAVIASSLCVGCGICVKKCPFNAIQIVKLPRELSKSNTLHSYGENSFRLYAVPHIRKNSCVGLLGANGLGKSTLLKILCGKIPLDLANNKDLKKLLSGNEIFKYIGKLHNDEVVLSYKPQDVLAICVGKRKNVIVKSMLEHVKPSLITKFKLEKLQNRRIKELSGGEIQRLVIALRCSKEANIYLFDEPSAFLDIKQRLIVAREILSLLTSTNYVVCVEHDLSILDYISDYIVCLYGQSNAFGVMTSLYGTANGINSYLNGYFKKENVKFRTQPIKFNLSAVNTNELVESDQFNYGKRTIDYGQDKFKLQIEKGSFAKNEIVLLVGENGTGKSTFISYVAGQVVGKSDPVFGGMSISYKNQNPYHLREGGGTVLDLLRNHIYKSLSESTFVNMVLKPLKVTDLYEMELKNLSGGQLQKVAISLCLGAKVDMYLLDEPSAYIDVDDRLHIAKIIKHYSGFYGKTVFLVEHDIIMATSISDSVIIFEGEPGVSCCARKPVDLRTGINKFLKLMGITMRKGAYSNRPRINKFNCQKDREQKKNGQYYFVEN